MLKSKEIFPEPLGTIVGNLLQVAEEASSRHQLSATPNNFLLSLLIVRAVLESYKAPIFYNRWLTSKGGNGWWRKFVRETQRTQDVSPGSKVRLPSYPGAIVLNLPHILNDPPANNALQLEFVKALGIPEDCQDLSTSRPPCTGLSAWADGNRFFCSIIRGQEPPLLIKSNRERNTEECLLPPNCLGVTAGFYFYPPTEGRDMPAVIMTRAFFPPDLFLRSFPR